jgi:hypothetical protein
LLWRSQRFEDILNNDYVEFIFKNIFLQIRWWVCYLSDTVFIDQTIPHLLFLKIWRHFKIVARSKNVILRMRKIWKVLWLIIQIALMAFVLYVA